jgi:predicted transport protein
MSDIKLFRVQGSKANNLQGSAFKLEKHLQDNIEQHMDVLLQMRFIASEHPTGKNHGGRIDSLALDENGCPVIIEYKRNTNTNVINQGLFYLDWLMDHKAEFEMMVLKQFGQKVVDVIDWTGPRLLCIAENFSKYDVHAVQQINRNIELIQYIHYQDGYLVLNLVNAVTAPPILEGVPTKKTGKVGKIEYKTIGQYMADMSEDLSAVYDEAREFMLELGDDVIEKELKYYIAFRRMKNFVTVQVAPTKETLYFYLNLDPTSIELEEGFSSDVSKVGHQGTGNLELRICSMEDLEKAKPYIKQSFDKN